MELTKKNKASVSRYFKNNKTAAECVITADGFLYHISKVNVAKFHAKKARCEFMVVNRKDIESIKIKTKNLKK